MSNLAEVMPTALNQNMPTIQNNSGIFHFTNFQEAAQAAQFLASSSLVPAQYRIMTEVKKGYGQNATTEYQNNPNAVANCLIALNMAQRMGYDPLMIMQNLYVIEGRPAWSSQFIIAAINACGKFAPLQFDMKNEGQKEIEYINTYWENGKKQTAKATITLDNLTCVAWTTDKKGNRIESAKISMELAVKEGWYQKNGSKWQTMPDQMLRYRAAAFFGRIYAPEILMGIYAADEIRDFIDVTPEPQSQPKPLQQQIPCYDINPLLSEIASLTSIDDCQAIGKRIADLSKDPTVNLCGDDLPTLRTAWKAKHDEIKAQAETVNAEQPSTEAPVEKESKVKPLDEAKELESNLLKAINAVTLENVDEVRSVLYAAKEQIVETKFAKFESMLDAKLNELVERVDA